MTSRLAAPLALFSLLSGCIAGQAPVSEDDSAIIGGTTDTADSAVVLVFAQQPGSTSGSLCTGEVISPHVVLTAAHCVSPVEVGQGAQFIVFTGSDFNNQASGQTLSVKETHPNPTWDSNNLPGGHDVGIVILNNPTTIKPLPYLRNNVMTQNMVGQSVRFVGYGLDNAAAQTGAGVKRQTVTTLSDFNTVLLHFADGTHETCNGDSGGPALMQINGGDTIVGTTSYGDVNCAQGGYDTKVDSETTFIDGYVNQFDPGMTGGTTGSTGGTTGGTTGGSTGAGDGSSNGPPGTGGSPTTGQPGGPASSSNGTGQAGQACTHDSDCASGSCGIGNTGTRVCVAGGNHGSGSGSLGGCSASAGARDASSAGLALLLMVGVGGLLRRGLRRRR
jgi:V8-like Glu-specific endopeptidase